MWRRHFAGFVISILLLQSSEATVQNGTSGIIEQPEIDIMQNTNGVIKFCNILTSLEAKKQPNLENFALINREYSKPYCARLTGVDTEYWDVNINELTLEGFCLSTLLPPTDVVRFLCDCHNLVDCHKVVVDYSLSADHCQRRVYTLRRDRLFDKKVQSCDNQQDLDDCRTQKSLHETVKDTNRHGSLSGKLSHLWHPHHTQSENTEVVDKTAFEFCNILPFPLSLGNLTIKEYTIHSRKFSYGYCIKKTEKTSILYHDVNFHERTLEAFCHSSHLKLYEIILPQCSFHDHKELHVIDYELPSGECQRRVYTRAKVEEYYKVVLRKCDQEEELQECRRRPKLHHTPVTEDEYYEPEVSSE